MTAPAELPVLLEAFFIKRLMAQRNVSQHTIASYRDTFRLLLQFAQKRLGRSPSKLKVQDLDALLIGAFLDDVEHKRASSVRTRNLRLTAIRSFFALLPWRCPSTPVSFNECCPSHRNDTVARWSGSSPAMKSKRFWRRLTGVLGSEDAITRSCS